jgi:DNA-binding transcriptional LysR family regulator
MASPDFLRRAGRPKRPEQLAGMEWLALTLLPAPFTWRFEAKSGEITSVQVKARIRMDSPATLRTMLRKGAGISVLDEHSAREDIEAGRLVRVLGDWKLQQGGIHAVYPPGRHVPPKVRAFIDFYRAWLQRQ